MTQVAPKPVAFDGQDWPVGVLLDTMRTSSEAGRPFRIFSPALERELDRHLGKWIACTNSRFLAEGATAEEAGRRAHELGFERFLLWRLPAADEEWFL